MKKPLLFVILVLFATLGFSQRVYFIYLQSDNAQPFYARLDEKVYSSTASGYLIIPSLRDTAHQLAIGFVNGEIPEHRFNIMLHRKDRGYLIKNFGERGWGLFDMQELSIISPVRDKSSSMKTERLPSNQFTDMLVRAADDTTLRDRPILVKEEKKPAEIQSKTNTTAQIDPPADKKENKTADKAEQTETVKTESKEAKTDPPIDVKPQEQPKETKNADIKTGEPKNNEIKEQTKPVDTKVTDNKTTEPKLQEKSEMKVNNEMNNALKEQTKVDTIAASIDEKIIDNNTSQTPTKEPEYVRSTILRRSESSTTEGFGLTFVDLLPGGGTDTIRIMIPNPSKNFGIKQEPEKPKEDKRFLEIGTDSAQQAATVARPANCKDVATDSDFFKLRKKMASASSDESMLGEARKAFRTKCYSTEHIKNISTLFLRDEGKYKFFDAAYGAVSDPANFGVLGNELKEEYYVNRFRAMLK